MLAKVSVGFAQGRQRHLEEGRLDCASAWKDWLLIAPDEWIDERYKDQPWNNPKLSAAERYMVKYRQKPGFKALERKRTIKRKSKNKRHDIASTYMRSSIISCINRQKQSNRQKEVMHQMLGLDANELVQNLEQGMHSSMGWDAFCDSSIHLDHIIPKRYFDQWSDEEFRDCWSIENIQLLWAEQNQAKSYKACESEACPRLWAKYSDRIQSNMIVETPFWSKINQSNLGQ